jgi:hypothetical protein
LRRVILLIDVIIPSIALCPGIPSALPSLPRHTHSSTNKAGVLTLSLFCGPSWPRPAYRHEDHQWPRRQHHNTPDEKSQACWEKPRDLSTDYYADIDALRPVRIHHRENPSPRRQIPVQSLGSRAIDRVCPKRLVNRCYRGQVARMMLIVDLIGIDVKTYDLIIRDILEVAVNIILWGYPDEDILGGIVV